MVANRTYVGALRKLCSQTSSPFLVELARFALRGMIATNRSPGSLGCALCGQVSMLRRIAMVYFGWDTINRLHIALEILKPSTSNGISATLYIFCSISLSVIRCPPMCINPRCRSKPKNPLSARFLFASPTFPCIGHSVLATPNVFLARLSCPHEALVSGLLS